MRNVLIKSAAAAVLLVGAVSQSSANGWEVWSEKQGADRLTIVASFGGDGLIEEAQLDMKLGAQFEVIDTQVLRKGSVCFANSEKNILRAVPPSGAGTALKSKVTDTCMYTLRVSSKSWSPENIVGTSLVECASSVKGIVPCEAAFKVVK